MNAAQPNKWFLAQWKLMREATRDGRLSAGDHAVLLEILDLHLDQFGNSRCSWAHLMRTTGRSRSAIAESVGRLLHLGYISIVGERRGSAETTYKPSWGFTPNGPPEQTITDGPPEQTMMVSHSTPLEPVMVRLGGPHIHLPQPPTGALTVGVSLSESRDAAPPHAAPGGAPEVDALAVAFEELWNCYGRRTKRQEAKAAFTALAPDSDLMRVILAAAQRWHEHYEAAGTAPQYRKQLHTWLRGECFLEDPPAPRLEGRSALDKSRRARVVVTPPTFTAGPCEIVDTDHMNGDDGEEVGVLLQPDTGAPFWRRFQLDLGDDRRFARLFRAAGLVEINDTEELHGRLVFVDGADYRPIAANDNGRAAAA